MQNVDLSGAWMPLARFVGADLSGACCIEADLWSSQVADTSYPGSDLSGANLAKTGIYRQEALRKFPDIVYSDATRWDEVGI